MADRIVYLVSRITAKMRGTSLEWVDDEGLSAIMSEGYEQVSAMERKVGGTKATMIVLRPSGENRGVTRVQQRDDVEMRDEYGGSRQMSVMHAMAETQRELSLALQQLGGGAGHLGGTRNHSMPGVSIISGELVGKAFDLGLSAAKQGKGAEACPFPRGSAPRTQWLSGYRAAGGCGPSAEVSITAQQQAFDNGYATARSLGRDDDVHCPYPPGSALRGHWLDGFRGGGGRIL